MTATDSLPDPRLPPSGPRERMIRSAARLIEARGVCRTGMREIVERADAPRGSLQHYFPGGKEQLVAEAVSYAGSVAAFRTARAAERTAGDPRPGTLFRYLVETWRRVLREYDYEAGCPLLATVADVAADGGEVREAVGRMFTAWQQLLRSLLAERGVPPDRAGDLATVAIGSLEGALVIARATRDLEPVDAVAREIGALLDGAVPPQAP